MAKWNTYAALAAAAMDDADVMPIADMSLADGSRQRTVTVAELKTLFGAALSSVVTSAGALTLVSATHLGAHVRVTAAGAVTPPAGLPIGWSCVIENATVSDAVTIADTNVTLVSAGVSVANGKWVALTVVDTNVVAVAGAFADEAATPIDINAQTGTTYALVIGDAGALVTLSNAAAITLTVPLDSSVAFPVGATVECAQVGAGLVSIAGATGVTINATTPGAETSLGQWSRWRLTKLSADAWLADGDLA